MLKFHVSVVFFDGEVRSNLPFLKRAEIVFLLAANTQSHLNSLSKDNCRIIKYKSVFSLCLDFI